MQTNGVQTIYRYGKSQLIAPSKSNLMVFDKETEESIVWIEVRRLYLGKNFVLRNKR